MSLIAVAAITLLAGDHPPEPPPVHPDALH
jgi:hypothetical protein